MDFKNISKKNVIILLVFAIILLLGIAFTGYMFWERSNAKKTENDRSDRSSGIKEMKKVENLKKQELRDSSDVWPQDEERLLEETRKWNSSIISHNIPEKMKANEKRLFKITVKNTGFITWDNSLGDYFGLKAVDYTHPWRIVDDKNYQVEPIGKVSVAPGKTHQFSILIKAPGKRGKNLFYWRMYKILNEKGWNFFGDSIKQEIEIK